jgi:flap endonuclease-1
MGIKDLLPFLSKRAPEAFVPFAQWKAAQAQPLVVAIDTPIFMFKYAYSVGAGQALRARMIKFALELREKGLEPIFVFDGQQLPDKDCERARRAQAQQKAVINSHRNDTLTLCGEEIEVERTTAPAARPHRDDYAQLKADFVGAGIRTDTALFEAEAKCAHLCAVKEVCAVMTEDSDALAYLSEAVILGWNKNERVANAVVAARALGLTQTQFQEFCVILGNDFNERIKGLGPVKALRSLKKHGSMRGVLHSEGVEPADSDRMAKTHEIFRSKCYESLA